MVRERVIENEGGREKGGESSVEDEKSKRIKNVKFMHRGGSVLHMAHCTNVFTSHYGLRRGGGANPWHAPLDCHRYIKKTNHLER